MEFWVVVRQDEAELFAHLSREFPEPPVAVIRDRRTGERRCRQLPRPAERRRGERRDRSVTWNALGFVVRRRRG